MEDPVAETVSKQVEEAGAVKMYHWYLVHGRGRRHGFFVRPFFSTEFVHYF